MIASYDYALETLYLAKGEGMINGDFAFIVFQLNQLRVTVANQQSFWWFYHTLNLQRLVCSPCKLQLVKNKVALLMS